MFSSVSALIGRIENEMTGLGSLPLRDFGCRNVFGLEDSVPKAPWMNRKVSIVIALLVATTVAGALTAPAEAALVKIIHLDCAQWHARLALLAKRKAHPRPPGAHHFAGRRHRVRIHFVCDCKDGAADDSAVDDLPAGDGGPGRRAARATRRRSPSWGLRPVRRPHSAGPPSRPAPLWERAREARSRTPDPAPGPRQSLPMVRTPFLPATGPRSILQTRLRRRSRSRPVQTPLGPFPPLDPTTPPIASNVPEPSTWLLFGLGAAALVLAMKRRSDEPGRPMRDHAVGGYGGNRLDCRPPRRFQ